MKKNFVLVLLIVLYSLNVSSQEWKNPLVFGNKRITLISPTLYRLEYAENAKFLDDPTMFAYDRSHLLKEYQVKSIDNGAKYEITTSALRIVFDNDNLPFGALNFKVFFTLDGKEKSTNGRGYHGDNTVNLGGAITTLDEVSSPIPLQDGLLSRDGFYYIMDANTEVLKNGWFERRSKEHVQDIYCFVYGKDYRTALKDLGLISGHVPMTRKYVHGIWYCRWWPYKSEEVYALVNEYKQNNFPLDIMVLDMDWHTVKDAKTGTGHAWTKGWTGYTWNKELIPDPVKLIGDLKKDSILVCLNEHPHDGIRSHESMYAGFMKAMGENPDGNDLPFNAGDKKYMTNFLKYAHGEGWDMDVAFWWLDWQQDYLFPTVRGSNNMSHLTWLNKLYFEDSKQKGLRGAGYSRWSGWGDQRYPIQFSGDAVANWDMLKFEIKLTTTSGNAGCYYWAHDIGGFYGGKDPELLSRWCQFGALSAALRVHATLDKDLDRRPWIWGEQATNSMRKSYHLRAELMPYLYSSIWQTHKTMVPLNRAMYIDYSNDPLSYEQPQQFMFGDLLLAAPIASAGKGSNKVAEQNVWFPKGNMWYDFFTGEKHNGGSKAVVSKDIDQFPLYVKGGYLFPMQPYSAHPASAPLDKLVLRVYPGEDGADNSYTLYEDDGVTTEYEKGKYATTILNYKRNGSKEVFTIEATSGEYSGQPLKRSYKLELPVTKNIKVIRVNGKKVKTETDPVTGIYCINVEAQSVKKPVMIEVETETK